MHWWLVKFLAVGLVWFSSVTQSCSTLWDPMDCSTPGFLSITNYQSLLKLVFIESDEQSLFHPLSSSSPTFNLSQHQGLFQRVSSLNQVAKVLEFQLQHQSSQWIFRTDFLQDWLVWSPCSLRDSQESSPWLWGAFSSTTVQKHWFFGAQLSL